MNILKKTKLAMAMTAFVGIASVSSVSAIEVKTDGSGRILMAPVMMATRGNSTQVTVTNTNITHAVKAHLAIRTEKESKEVFDFIIYMSPGDVFRGEFYSKLGKVMFRSSDDSIKMLGPIGATEEPPFVGDIDPNSRLGKHYVIEDYVISTDKIPDGDTIAIGHLEVVGIYSVTGNINAAKIQPEDSDVINVHRGMDKRSLRRIFDMPTPDLLARNNCTDGAMGGDSCNIDSVGSKSAVLRGDMTITFGEGLASNRVNYAMTGLVDSDEDGSGSIDCSVSYCEKVIANPYFNQDSGEEMKMGYLMGINTGTHGAAHNLYNIDRALSRGVHNGTYEQDLTHGTFMLASLPTKYMHKGNDYCTNPGTVVPLGSGDEYSAPFGRHGRVPYELVLFNNVEQACASLTPESVDEVKRITLAESGKTCADLDGGLDAWIQEQNPDGTLLCISKVDIIEEIIEHTYSYEVSGIPLNCGETSNTKLWFSINKSGWYSMKALPSTPQNISCGYNGVPTTIHTVKTKGDGTVLDVIPTSN
ncbi:MAG: hypothetical protein KAI02_03750 [Gammaproteobacteria bacterium]|nr:hypothetical protein [Gammaproteobacteria bacterium]